MQTRQRFILVILIVAAIVMLVGGTTTVFLYHVAFKQAEERLVETAKSRARIIESVARFNAEFSGNYPDGTEQATLSQILDAHKNFRGFGDTGEFVLARRVGDNIVFLLSHRHFDLDNPRPVPLESHIAEPMRRALRGRSGVLVGIDYRGEKVLAAHEPVAELNLGLVAKIDLAEIRAPFVKAGLLTFAFAVLTVIVGAGLITWLFNYMTRALETNRQELGEQQRLLQTVFDTIPHALYVKDREGRFMVVNHALAELHQLTTEDFVGFTGDELGLRTPEERQEFFKSDREAIETGKRVEIPEFVVTVPGGEEKIRRGVKLPLRDESGDVVGFVGVSEDITEQIQSREALRESEERFRAFFNNSPLAIFLKDRDGRYIMVNRQFEKWHRVSANDMIEKTPYEIYPSEFAERFAAQDQEVIDSGKEIVREVEVDMNDGVRRSVIISKFPLFDAEGEVTEVGTISADVTEHRKVEQQFRESQKMEAVGQLAGGIAHDFNNALQIIINGAHIARANLDDPKKAAEFLGSILKAGERTAGLTRQLLAYSRKAVIQPKTVNLNELTGNLVNLVDRVIGEEIELESRHDEDLHQVWVDPGMIEQAILNLCVNARDAMPNGGRLTIETKNFRAEQEFCESHGWEQPGDYAMVSLQDNGMGMPPEVVEHVFEPFFTTKGVGEGTGLGLATAYGIVRQHDGQMEVVSEPGAGSTFKIYLPGTDARVESEQVSAVPEATGGHETILVAEDEGEVLSILSRSLESKGYRVLAAMNGREAVSVFKENSDRIDLVILDMVMPAMRGREVFEQIREVGSVVPVLFFSGYSPDKDESAFLSDNGLRLIQKPYSPNELFASVREVLDQ